VPEPVSYTFLCLPVRLTELLIPQNRLPLVAGGLDSPCPVSPRLNPITGNPWS
jgi:hypothetical protein